MIDSAVSPWRLQIHSELPSTQDAAIEAASRGASGRLAILAAMQTKGRGSRGRVWQSCAGNLHMSLMLRPGTTAREPAYWPLLAAVVVYDALSLYSVDLLLKWPNDVLLRGRKIAGILIDRVAGPDGWVVIGMGVNLAAAPNVPGGQSSCCLPPPAPPPEDFARLCLERFDHWCDGDVRAAWLARAHPVGAHLSIATPTRHIEGRFAGLAPSGGLLLEGQDEPISSAEIFMSHPVTPAGCKSA